MICSAADSISKELSMEQSLNHVRKVKNQLSATIEAIPSGILFTDTLGVILQHNRIASQLLESYQNLKGERGSASGCFQGNPGDKDQKI